MRGGWLEAEVMKWGSNNGLQFRNSRNLQWAVQRIKHFSPTERGAGILFKLGFHRRANSGECHSKVSLGRHEGKDCIDGLAPTSAS